MLSSHAKERLELVAGVALVMLCRLVLRLRLRRRPDGWRRAAGLVLRGEAATFVLSAFDLDVWSDERTHSKASIETSQSHLARRLGEFLAKEPDIRFNIRRGADEDRVEACRGPSYTLGFEPWVEGPGRFVRPDNWRGDDRRQNGNGGSGEALLNFVCRVDRDGHADVWVRIDHLGADGVPIQEVMTRLETAWGMARDVLYPTPQEFAPHSFPRPCSGRRDLVELQAFVDFAPLLAWRNRENARLPESMTVAAALLWRLASHPAFAGLHMGTTVELHADGGRRRGVGVIVVRPEAYFDRPDGVARYVRDFNRSMNLTRRRASAGCRILDAAALIPARPATALLRHGLEQGTSAFGSLGLTMLKDAKVFGAPIADVGHVDGFIAVGRLTLPTRDGGSVGCVTIKGPAERIVEYPGLLRHIMRQPAQTQSPP
jgi:hypothetical protein